MMRSSYVLYADGPWSRVGHSDGGIAVGEAGESDV